MGPGLPPFCPPASGAQDIDFAREETRVKSFEGKQPPGVFTPAEFAEAGFYLPDQQAQPDQLQVVVRCWYCGVQLDEWKVGDAILEEHLRHSRATERVSDASCVYAQYMKQLRKWEGGGRVHPLCGSSRKEIFENFSSPPSRRFAERSGSDSEGGETPSSSSGAFHLPRRSKRAKVTPPPPPPPKPKPKGQAACLRGKPPPPPPKPAAVPAPPPKPPAPPLSSFAVSSMVVSVEVDP